MKLMYVHIIEFMLRTVDDSHSIQSKELTARERFIKC